ncbi:DNA methylase [Treponema sp.]|uniref:Y-family DNA polymerase n=1 Tax=Treponema sp. TaxID=166 RepID=UPI00298DA59D|nr:DNA methylase [Treponema sp.]MCR5612794.1 DNA methylase [Treponema sp.]
MNTYLAIDLKSFYASVECRERGLDPLTTKLVVADKSRTSKTICLAVTPALKAYGLSGRSRLFEVEAKAREIKRQTGKELEYITAVPRMALYIKYSAEIYSIYLKYFAPEDIHVYSIDEVFIDATSYLSFYKMSARELAEKVIGDILDETGITATAGIAPNLYLCKIAMDIWAKHIKPDKNGARIAELDEMTYRRELWSHKPITDFWRIGNGIARRLEKRFIYTMGDLARASLKTPLALYDEFGIDAEILIDHAWGRESVGMKDIKNYRSSAKSLGSGQVLHCEYTFEKARIVVREMAEALALDLFEKKLVTSSVTLYVGYDVKTLERFSGGGSADGGAARVDEGAADSNASFDGEIVKDYYGRLVPKPAHGTTGFSGITGETNLADVIADSVVELYDKIVNPLWLIRRLNITANNTKHITEREPTLFDSETDSAKEENLQKARLSIIKKYGKNAILKGSDYEEGATARDRNAQIGGHKA